jgi:Tfp pilus assembly protein FimT
VTLIEIMVVLAILGGLMAALMGSGLVAQDDSRLREDARLVLAVLRSARHQAMTTGRQHRVHFDLDQQTYQIEICESPVLQKPADEEEEVDQDKLQELVEKMQNQVSSDYDRELLEAQSPEQALEAAAALEGVRIGGARCQLSTRGSGHSQTQRTDFKVENYDAEASEHGVKITRIDVAHRTEAATEGRVSINFFPIGSAEKAVVRLENDDGTVFNVLVHGMTGRIEFKFGKFEPEKHMLRDGAGEDVEQREAEH